MTRIATTILLALVISMAGTACTGTSPEALRKEAQSNADKYLEFMRAGDFEGAYAKTLHADYKRQLALETFLKYREAIASTAGAIESYQVVHYDSDVERESVTLDYAVKYSRMPEPGTEIVKLRREGTEWRLRSSGDERWGGLTRLFDPETDREKIDRVRRRLALGHRIVRAIDVGDLPADRQHRMQRRARILHDEADVLAANLAEGRFLQRQQIRSLERHRSGNDAARRFDEAHQRDRRRGFAAARLAHEADELAGADVERKISDDRDLGRPVARKRDLKILGRQDDRPVAARRRLFRLHHRPVSGTRLRKHGRRWRSRTP